MGTWGAGLYSSDYALDLRGSISALSRLPFSGDDILTKLRENEAPANDEQDEDHTIFWLVTAEQFAKRGIACHEALERALDIIETGKDIAMMTELGLPAASARQRKKKLDELAAFLRKPVARVARKTLKAPQPILMPANTAWRYPTRKGKSRNPYFATAEEENFVVDGWGACIVVQAERAFGWLAWYMVAPVCLPGAARPELADVLESSFFSVYVDEFDRATRQYIERESVRGGAGTVSKQHLARMQFECVGNVEVDETHIPKAWHRCGVSAAVSDISIANHLHPMGGMERRPPECPRVRAWLRH